MFQFFRIFLGFLHFQFDFSRFFYNFDSILVIFKKIWIQFFRILIRIRFDFPGFFYNLDPISWELIEFEKICFNFDSIFQDFSMISRNWEKIFQDFSGFLKILIVTRFRGESESPVEEGAPLLSSENQAPSIRNVFVESSEYTVDLPTFLIQRACANSALVNYFYWSTHINYYYSFIHCIL